MVEVTTGNVRLSRVLSVMVGDVDWHANMATPVARSGAVMQWTTRKTLAQGWQGGVCAFGACNGHCGPDVAVLSTQIGFSPCSVCISAQPAGAENKGRFACFACDALPWCAGRIWLLCKGLEDLESVACAGVPRSWALQLCLVLQPVRALGVRGAYKRFMYAIPKAGE